MEQLKSGPMAQATANVTLSCWRLMACARLESCQRARATPGATVRGRSESVRAAVEQAASSGYIECDSMFSEPGGTEDAEGLREVHELGRAFHICAVESLRDRPIPRWTTRGQNSRLRRLKYALCHQSLVLEGACSVQGCPPARCGAQRAFFGSSGI